ncbi:hypothetical protein PpBr36_06816, partial [Pyricularia pennisetigena]|uniref:hypothetical protein n=1 Tax=Pyricularia pennisetigena TaxID=1578925 RepID=UPI001150E566
MPLHECSSNFRSKEPATFRPLANRRKDGKANIHDMAVYLLRAETLPSARMYPSAQADSNLSAEALPLTYRGTILASAFVQNSYHLHLNRCQPDPGFDMTEAIEDSTIHFWNQGKTMSLGKMLLRPQLHWEAFV